MRNKLAAPQKKIYKPKVRNNNNSYNNNNNNSKSNFNKKPRYNKYVMDLFKSDRKQFKPHIYTQECDNIMDQNDAVLFVGEISISKYNPQICYVNVDGIPRDIKICGTADRNRAFHGDIVIVSLYPSQEWTNAISQDVIDFEERLDATDSLHDLRVKLKDMNLLDKFDNKTIENAVQQNKGNIDDALKWLKNYNDVELEFYDDNNDPSGTENNNNNNNNSNNNNHNYSSNTSFSESVDDDDIEREYNKTINEDNYVHRIHGYPLNNKFNVTAYDRYKFLLDCQERFNTFNQDQSQYSIDDINHPWRYLINAVKKELNGDTPTNALKKFKWDKPTKHPDLVPRGRVIGIYDRASELDDIVGYLNPTTYSKNGTYYLDDNTCLFTPIDKRYPKAWFKFKDAPKQIYKLFTEYVKLLNRFNDPNPDRKFNKNKTPNDYMDRIKLSFVVVKYTKLWKEDWEHPNCDFVKYLGERGNIEVETKLILSKQGIKFDQKFDPEIINEVTQLNISEDDFKERLDLREDLIFTIDPTSARDFDDAISIKDLNETNSKGKKLYRVGIHIADVTHFVREGMKVDDEARLRCTSVYLVDRCLPMLPHYLCQNLCSLNPNVNRLAFSVLVTLTEDGRLVIDNKHKTWCGKTVINSKARLDYETAHFIIENKFTENDKLPKCCFISESTTFGEIKHHLNLFWNIAKKMRKRRFKNGSIKFFRKRLRFRLDESNNRAVLFGPEVMLTSNHLIEEMMLLANQLIAFELVTKLRELAVLRRHEQPSSEKAKKLLLLCRSQKIGLTEGDLLDSKCLNESLIDMQSHVFNNGYTANDIINNLLSSAMMRAQYICCGVNTDKNEWRHWALNFPLYTHFTSPIRRYADVMVHRALQLIITNNKPTDKILIENKQKIIAKQCKKCNIMTYAASQAELESQKIHLCLILIDQPITCESVIIGFHGATVFEILVPNLGLTHRISLKELLSLPDNAKDIINASILFQMPTSLLRIEWRSGKIEVVKLFEKLKVKLYSVLKTPLKIYCKIISPQNRNNNNDNSVQGSPIAMTLDEQIKVGTSDFYAGNYD